MTNFELYQTFTNKEDLNEAIEKLENAFIKFKLNDRSVQAHEVNPGHISINVELYILSSDVDKVNDLLLSEIEGEYYLYDFTDDELIEVVIKRDEWNELDVELAEKILKERGRNIDMEQVKLFNQSRLQEQIKPGKNNSVWIIAGYIFAIFGGIIPIFIGLHIQHHKKKLINGEEVHAFTPEERIQGQYIFYLGLFFLIAYIAIGVFFNTF